MLFKMINRLQQKRRKAGESGHAFVEFSLCMLFIVPILAGIVDVGRGLILYLTLSRATYEGARYMATLPGLTEGKCETDAGSVLCPADKAMHQLVRTRLGPIYRDTILEETDVQKTTTELFGPGYKSASDPTMTGEAKTAAEERVVRVTITADFDPLFPTFGYLNSLTAHSSGPYLLNVTP